MPPPPNTWEDDEETIVSDSRRGRRADEDVAGPTSSGAPRPDAAPDHRATGSAGPPDRPGADEDELATLVDAAEDEPSTIRADAHATSTPLALPPAWLVITVSTRGSDRHRLIQLQAVRTVIGRDAGRAYVLVDDPAVSRQHAAIRFEPRPGGDEGEGEFILYDLASTHGTLLNGERVAAPRALRDGDRIRLGATELAFKRL